MRWVRFSIGIVGCMLGYVVWAQIPKVHSVSGFGDLLPMSSTSLRAMGGVSTAVTDFSGVNLVNPATLGYIYKGENRKIMFDVGMNVRQQFSVQDGVRNVHTSSNINNVSLQFPVKQNMGMALAFQPQALIRYTHNEQMVTSEIRDTARGNLSQLLLAYGYHVKKWNVGLNVGYLFGQKRITHLQQQTVVSTTDPNTLSSLQYFYNGMQLNWGTLYTERLVSDVEQISNTYLKVGFRVQYVPFIVGTKEGVQRVIGRDAYQEQSRLFLSRPPLLLGWGILLDKEYTWSLGVDANFQQWQGFRFDNENNTYVNLWKVSAGGSFTPNYKSQQYFKRIPIKLGVQIGNYPLLIDRNRTLQWGIMSGLSIPLKRYAYTNQSSVINIAFEYLQRSGGVRESFFNFVISVALSDLWFIKSFQQ